VARILFGSSPASGHVRPGLPIARELVARGIPVVVAGVTEGKNEIAARVGWSNVGINLKTERPSPQQIRDAVQTVLRDPSYRRRAEALQARYAEHDAGAEAATLIEGLL
jgi:UDP:flavonoid glycosyltransferase YjiC (YdhE family)